MPTPRAVLRFAATLCGVCGTALSASRASAQSTTAASTAVDTLLARQYFAEADALCTRERGALWGVSLCGPMVFADAATGTIATNRPEPEDTRPRILGLANAAWRWGSDRWSTFVWSMIPRDDAQLRARLMAHELFHRVQTDLGLFNPAAPSADHLDAMEPRYWLLLEYRALARALESRGDARKTSIRDALAFRFARTGRDSAAANAERLSELNEGLAQYTGTVVAAGSHDAAVVDAIAQLQDAATLSTFVRTFAYPMGAAYGVLLDEYAPGWTRAIDGALVLPALLATSMGVTRTDNVTAAARSYGGDALRAREEERERERLARVAELRARFVAGPVLVVPRGQGATFRTDGITPLGTDGTVVPRYRVDGPWGRLEADQVLVSPDGTHLTLPGPVVQEDRTLRGTGWTVQLADGWALAPGVRAEERTLVPPPG